MDIIKEILFSSPIEFPTIVVRLVLSTLLTGFIGFERGFRGRAAGLRTHILVGIGSTIIVMTGIYGVENCGYQADPMRMAAQVISGIGFLGAGTILVRGKTMVMGLTTAAGLWVAAAIGIAVGAGFYGAAAVGSFIALFTFIFLTTFERGGSYGKNSIRLYIECTDPTKLNELITVLTSDQIKLRDIEVTSARSGLPNHIGIEAMLIMHRCDDKTDRIDKILKLEHVLFAIESV